MVFLMVGFLDSVDWKANIKRVMEFLTLLLEKIISLTSLKSLKNDDYIYH